MELLLIQEKPIQFPLRKVKAPLSSALKLGKGAASALLVYFCYNRIRQKATTKDSECNDTPDAFAFDVLKAVFALYAAGSIADSGALE